jgi:hypothetical protein
MFNDGPAVAIIHGLCVNFCGQEQTKRSRAIGRGEKKNHLRRICPNPMNGRSDYSNRYKTNASKDEPEHHAENAQIIESLEKAENLEFKTEYLR